MFDSNLQRNAPVSRFSGENGSISAPVFDGKCQEKIAAAPPSETSDAQDAARYQVRPKLFSWRETRFC